MILVNILLLSRTLKYATKTSMETWTGDRKLLVALHKMSQTSSQIHYISHAQLVVENHMAFGF